MIGLRPILSDSHPKTMKNGVPSNNPIAIVICALIAGTLQRLSEEEQRIELSAVPDHGFAGGGAEQGKDCNLEVRPCAECFRQGPLGSFAFGFHFLEHRRLVQAEFGSRSKRQGARLTARHEKADQRRTSGHLTTGQAKFYKHVLQRLLYVVPRRATEKPDKAG